MKGNISRQKTVVYNKIYASFLTIVSFIIFICHCLNTFNVKNNRTYLFNLMDKFTYQSNFLILIVMFLFFTSLRYKKIFSILMFIAAINILLTSSLVHLVLFTDEKRELLSQIKQNIIFLDICHYHHTIIPILYLIFYFSKTNRGLNVKKAYLGLIHPLCYFFFFLFANLFRLFKPPYYPYDIIDPYAKGIFKTSNPDGQGYFYVFLTIIILTMIYYCLSYSVLFLKTKSNFFKKS